MADKQALLERANALGNDICAKASTEDANQLQIKEKLSGLTAKWLGLIDLLKELKEILSELFFISFRNSFQNYIFLFYFCFCFYSGI